MQLERLAADKAAQQLQLERDLQVARQEAQQVGSSHAEQFRAGCTLLCMSGWFHFLLGRHRAAVAAHSLLTPAYSHTPSQCLAPACLQVKRRAAVERSISAADDAASLVPMDRIGDAYQR